MNFCAKNLTVEILLQFHTEIHIKNLNFRAKNMMIMIVVLKIKENNFCAKNSNPIIYFWLKESNL